MTSTPIYKVYGFNNQDEFVKALYGDPDFLVKHSPCTVMEPIAPVMGTVGNQARHADIPANPPANLDF